MAPPKSRGGRAWSSVIDNEKTRMEVGIGMMNLNNGVLVQARYSGKHELRHVECVAEGDQVLVGPLRIRQIIRDGWRL